MIYLEFYHFIIPLKTLEAKYKGGVIKFKKDIPNDTYKDDGQLATARFLSIDDINYFVELVAENGLDFNKSEFFSKDFAVFTTLGMWWTCKWLTYNMIVCRYSGIE